MRVRRLIPIAVLAVAATAHAQQDRAPRETVTALVNGKKVTVEYGRPSLRGRNVKDLLAQLPANRVWRAGVDQATTFTTEADVLVGGKRVPAGKYTLYLHAPESGAYELLINRDLGVPLKSIYAAAPASVADAMWPHIEDYPSVKDKEVARIALKSAPAHEGAADRFLIGLTPAKDGVSGITLSWGDQSWTTDVRAAGK
jgi:DUF2911 family protein